MTKPANEIHSVKDLLDILDTLGEAEHGKTRFFRGHSKSSYLMLPSIYRQSYLIENEDKIIRDAIVNCPDDFSPNDTLFEKLVKLQHYGYTTRLLDLTSNALVALYFATSSQEDEDGELIILDIPHEQTKYDDSDTVAILSAISLQNHLFGFDENEIKLSHLIVKSNFRKYLEGEHPEISFSEEFIDKLYNYIITTPITPTLINEIGFEEYLTRYIKGILAPNKMNDGMHLLHKGKIKELTINYFNSNLSIKKLLHTIREDKYNFEPNIDIDDFSKVLCVRAKLNNARISRQQGLFLLFGINGKKVNPANVPDEWLRKVNKQQIIIKNKKQIMKELKSFGISKQTLFPELESQAQEIMAQYKPK